MVVELVGEVLIVGGANGGGGKYVEETPLPGFALFGWGEGDGQRWGFD